MKQNNPMTSRLAGSLGSTFSGGTMRFYTGSIPDDVDAIITDTLLCEIALPSPAFSPITANGQARKVGVWAGTVIANGVCGWAKISSSAVIHWIFVTAAEMNLITNVMAIGDTVTINTGTYTCPEE